MHLRLVIAAAWVGGCAMLGLAPQAAAHPRGVGVLQARFVEPDRLQVLLKLDTDTLLGSMSMEPESAPALLMQPGGERAFWDWLLTHHSVESWDGLCERLTVDRYALSPTGQWLDVLTTYRCAPPVSFVLVRMAWALSEDDHVMVGHLDAGHGAVSTVLFDSAQDTHALYVEPSPASPDSPPKRPLPVPLWSQIGRLLLHAEFFLLPLVLASAPTEDRRLRYRMLCMAVVVMIVMVWLPGWLRTLSRVPDLMGLASLVGLGGTVVQYTLLGRPLRMEDSPLVLLLAVCAGLALARDGAMMLDGSLLVGLAVSLPALGISALCGLGVQARPRLRRVASLLVLVVFFFLVTGELFRLALL